jgi:hypothetical protein
MIKLTIARAKAASGDSAWSADLRNLRGVGTGGDGVFTVLAILGAGLLFLRAIST